MTAFCSYGRVDGSTRAAPPSRRPRRRCGFLGLGDDLAQTARATIATGEAITRAVFGPVPLRRAGHQDRRREARRCWFAADVRDHEARIDDQRHRVTEVQLRAENSFSKASRPARRRSRRRTREHAPDPSVPRRPPASSGVDFGPWPSAVAAESIVTRPIDPRVHGVLPLGEVNACATSCSPWRACTSTRPPRPAASMAQADGHRPARRRPWRRASAGIEHSAESRRGCRHAGRWTAQPPRGGTVANERERREHGLFPKMRWITMVLSFSCRVSASRP